MFGPEVLTFIGTSVVINGLLAAAMIFLAKSWISERLRNAIEHEYKMKLETYKHQLRSEHDVAIERLRADVARDQALQSVVASSFSEGQRAAHERRLNAVEVIWKALVGMRDQLPIVIEVLDVLTPDKYHQVLGNPDIRKEINEMSEEGLAEISGKGTREAEMARPFYGEYIYSLFCAYRSISVSAVLSLINGRVSGHIEPWYEDPALKGVFSVLMSPEELKRFEAEVLFKFVNIREKIEKKILDEIRKIVIGEEAGNDSLQFAGRLMAALAKLDEDPQRAAIR